MMESEFILWEPYFYLCVLEMNCVGGVCFFVFEVGEEEREGEKRKKRGNVNCGFVWF